jgi:hypothetical protein
MKRTVESNVTCLSAASSRPVRSRTVAFGESEDYGLLQTHDKHTSGQKNPPIFGNMRMKIGAIISVLTPAGLLILRR